jgi:hypothetical protein
LCQEFGMVIIPDCEIALPFSPMHSKLASTFVNICTCIRNI